MVRDGRVRAVIPPAFLRAVMRHESGGNPRAVSPTGARGLMQITRGARETFNRATGARWSADDLFRPDVSVTIGAWLLRVIARSYARHHPRSLATDWGDARWLQLLVLGWNRGFSEEGGVGKVVGALEREGWRPEAITARAVVANAARFGAARTLYDDPAAHVRWSGDVVATYMGARPRLADAARAGAGPVGVVAGLALATAIGVAWVRR